MFHFNDAGAFYFYFIHDTVWLMFNSLAFRFCPMVFLIWNQNASFETTDDWHLPSRFGIWGCEQCPVARYSDSRQSQCSQCEAKLRSWRWLVSGPFIFRAIHYCSTWEIFILDRVLYDVVCHCLPPWFGDREEVSMLTFLWRYTCIRPACTTAGGLHCEYAAHRMCAMCTGQIFWYTRCCSSLEQIMSCTSLA